MAVDLRQSKACHPRADWQGEPPGIDREPRPPARSRQVAALHEPGTANLAECDRRPVAPDDAMVPAVLRVELHHHGLGRIGRIEPDMCKDFGSRGDLNRLGTAAVEILAESRGRPLEAAGTGDHVPGLHGGEPGSRPTGTAANVGPNGKRIVEPDGFDELRRRLRADRCRIDVRQGCQHTVHLALERWNPGVERGQLLLLLGRRKHDRGRRPQDVAIEARVGRRIEKGVERIKLPVRDRVELMAVADGALAGQAHPGIGHRGGAVDGIAKQQLIVDRSPLARRHIAAGESGGDLLVERGVWQQVTGELFDRKPIERHVGVERLHDPVAVGPHLPLVVEVETVGVGIAGDVEPVAGHLLAVMGALQQTIDRFLIRIRRGIGDEGIDLRQGRRKPRERERQSPDERWPVGLGVDRQALRHKPRFEKSVDRIVGLVRHVGPDPFGNLRPRERLERPVLLVGSSGGDPAREQIFLLGRERLLRMRRRHHHVGIGGGDPGDDFARGQIAGDNRASTTFKLLRRMLCLVESQPGLLAAGPVAGVAVLGEERPDVAVKPEPPPGRLGRRGRNGAQREQRGQQCMMAAWLGRATHEMNFSVGHPRRRLRAVTRNRGPFWPIGGRKSCAHGESRQ